MKTKQNPMDRAFDAGFACGASGCSKSETPYKGPSAGYRRAMSNMWESGYLEGCKYARELKEVLEDRDKAESLLVKADNALTASNWAVAEPLLIEAAHRLQMSASACRYLSKTKPALNNPTP